MRNRTLDVAFSCFMTGLIGGLLTLALALQFDWGWLPIPFGIVLSGLGAYFFHDLPQLKSGLARAWHEAISWRPDWERVGLTLVNGGLRAMMYTGVLFWLFYMVAIARSPHPVGIDSLPTLKPLVVLCVALWAASTPFFMFVTHVDAGSGPEGMKNLREDRRQLSLNGLLFNPVSLLFVAAYYAIKAPISLVHNLPRILREAAEILWRLISLAFLYIHSQERRIRMTSTMLGMAIGCIWGYQHEAILAGALLCGAAGAVFGALEYQLVSVRLLKLVPAAD